MKKTTTIPDIFDAATFDEIKDRLISWLRGQDEFKDYDFEGSRMNILLDLLAYNTLYIQQFSNAAQFESFIRTAFLRSSVVQHAQDNGYYPDSKTATGTTFMIRAVNPLNPTSIRIPRGTKFVAVVKDTTTYPFVTLEDSVIVRSTNNTYESLIKVAQGRIVRTQLKYSNKKPIIIRDPDIDRSTVKLLVDGAEWVDWTNESMVNASGASTIFYQRETIDGFTEFYFGEGEASTQISGGALEAEYVGGLKPIDGSDIVIEYLNTKGEVANGARDFSYVDTLVDIKITDIIENPFGDADYVGTSGGGDPEKTERIREMAPIMRESQRRCVTAADYEAFVSMRFGSIVQAVQCFTDREKPGYAFIAIKPKQGLRLTTVQKDDIEQFLSKYNLAPVTPAILDPNYLYLTQKVKVTYRLNELSNSEEWLRGQVLTEIDNYYTEEVEIFNKSFSKSKMLTYVDSADQSIIGSSAVIGMVREVDNFYKSPMSGIKFLNQMSNLYSSTFTFTPDSGDQYEIHYVETVPDSDGVSKLLAGPFVAGDITQIDPYTGTDFSPMVQTSGNYYVVGEVNHLSDSVTYDLGVLNKPSTSFTGAYIEFHATPDDTNIFTRDGSLIVFENDLRPQYTTIEMEPITL